MIWSEHPARVRAPATSANLGPGFDSLGLALALYDEVEAQVTGAGLAVAVSGEGAETAEAGERHLVVRAMRAAFGAMGGQPPGIALRCVNVIPHGRGLGSSAAAVVSGVLAARALVAGGADLLPDAGVLALAVDLEGHPDNVAACLAGGLTLAWRRGAPRARRSPTGQRGAVVPGLRSQGCEERAASGAGRRRRPSVSEASGAQCAPAAGARLHRRRGLRGAHRGGDPRRAARAA